MPIEVRLTKQRLGWPTEPPFLIPEAAAVHMRQAIARGQNAEAARSQRMQAYALAFPDLAAELQCSLRGELPSGLGRRHPDISCRCQGMATRAASGKVMNAMTARLSALTGGSADLDTSTKTALKVLVDFNPPSSDTDDTQGSNGGGWSHAGRNLHFGVREHAMGAVGEDGPTHQPAEQLARRRSHRGGRQPRHHALRRAQEHRPAGTASEHRVARSAKILQLRISQPTNHRLSSS